MFYLWFFKAVIRTEEIGFWRILRAKSIFPTMRNWLISARESQTTAEFRLWSAEFIEVVRSGKIISIWSICTALERTLLVTKARVNSNNFSSFSRFSNNSKLLKPPFHFKFHYHNLKLLENYIFKIDPEWVGVKTY